MSLSSSTSKSIHHLAKEKDQFVQFLASEKLFKGTRAKVIKLLLEGCSAEEIATLACLSIDAVRKQIRILKDKTGAKSLHGLTTYLSMLLVFSGQLTLKIKNGKPFIVPC